MFDDSRVYKAGMVVEMCVNLAFFRNTSTTIQLDCQLDLAQFKQYKPYKPKQSKVVGIPGKSSGTSSVRGHGRSQGRGRGRGRKNVKLDRQEPDPTQKTTEDINSSDKSTVDKNATDQSIVTETPQEEPKTGENATDQTLVSETPQEEPKTDELITDIPSPDKPGQDRVTEYIVSLEVNDIDSNEQENGSGTVTVSNVPKNIEVSVSNEGESNVPTEELKSPGDGTSSVVEHENNDKSIDETQNVSESQGHGGTSVAEQDISSEPQSSTQDKINEQTGNNTDDQNVSANTNAGDDQVLSKDKVQQVIVGHVELESPTYTSPEDLQEKIIDNFKHKFLVVCVKRYPNLLKQYQEGNVAMCSERNKYERLCKIRNKEVRLKQVLDLDRLIQTMPLTAKVPVALDENKSGN